MTLLGSIHLCFAVIALTLGPMIFRRPKGNRSHVLSGRGYFISMVILNVSALPVFEISGQMTLFHFLAGISLLTVTTAWLTAVFRWPQRGWFAVHAHLACWSYAGLLSAGAGQIANMMLASNQAVLVACLGTLVASGLLIQLWVPVAIHNLVASRQSPEVTSPSG